MNPHIDYALLGQAVDFYTKRGYQYIEVPWMVDYASILATKPPQSYDQLSQFGYLVASGEQGFIQLMTHDQLEVEDCIRPSRPASDVTPLMSSTSTGL